MEKEAYSILLINNKIRDAQGNEKQMVPQIQSQCVARQKESSDIPIANTTTNKTISRTNLLLQDILVAQQRAQQDHN